MKFLHRHAFAFRVVAASVVLQAFAIRAMAQTPARLPPAEHGSRNWIVAAGVLVVVCSVGFVNAKRSHMK